MEKLIKPADYARKAGISRQAVYAKIKKGLLPSKSVDGKIYIIEKEEQEASSTVTGSASASVRYAGNENSMHELLSAKDETIKVLRETISDLKETNRMITTTLRGEVELLKEAFGEMKSLYAAQIEHMSRTEGSTLEEKIDDAEVEIESEKKEDKTGEWIPLETLLEKRKISGKKKREKILKRLRKRHGNGDLRIDRKKGRYLILTGSGIEEKIFSSIDNKKKK